ncbi:MAG: MarR family transcriptional regulator [Atopobiaceae bacterium]|nr:MarR family transcriptional regulator [Atopobiaceae bacterium]
MELREYLAIRRAYNLVRQDMSADCRLTFVELAILCRMSVLGRAMNTSEIAEYQGALRPTMTHRTKHLSELGFMVRSKGSADRRNVVCEITDEGKAFVDEACGLICDILRSGSVLSRTTSRRMCNYIDAMGSLTCMSGDLVLLGVLQAPDGRCTVSDLVVALGLLQPTVSMSVASLEGEGRIKRIKQDDAVGRSFDLALTDLGISHATKMEESIRALVIRRK